MFSPARYFVHPLFDVALIGGGLSLVWVGFLWASGRLYSGGFPGSYLTEFVLLSNVTHFAASTVRLYSKPGSFRDLPFYTSVLPALTLLVLTLALMWPEGLGRNLQALYLTWSPYHYAAQTFGLLTIYNVRSGCALPTTDRRLFWWACMLPFLYAFVVAPVSGLGWFLPPWVMDGHPGWSGLREQVGSALGLAVFAVPALLLVRCLAGSNRERPPLIAWLLIATNGIWWVAFSYIGGFGWATVFHGVQYLAIVLVFHLRDHPPAGPGIAAVLRRSITFYAACLGLGFLLFEIWPYFYVWLGFSFAESMLLCVAAINLHHFIVDRAIWRVRKDTNYRIVVGDAAE